MDAVTVVIGDFTQKEWIQVAPSDYAPSNVLTIGKDQSGNVLDIPPAGPIVPQPAANTGIIFQPTDACNGPCEILLHDSVSGWFFDSGIGFNDCSAGITAADVANIAQVSVPCGPAWAGRGGLAWCPVFDYWITGCGLGTVVPLAFGPLVAPNPPACATGHPPPCAAGEGLNAESCCVPPLDPPLPTRGLPAFLSLAAGKSRPADLGISSGFLAPAASDSRLPLLPTPLSIPIPTKGIAVTACNCDEDVVPDEEEILV